MLFPVPCRPWRFFLAFVVVLGLLPLLAAAQAVDRGLPSRVLRVPAEYATVQAAIDAAQAGDVVLVAPGVYLESIDFRGKAIEVVAPAGPRRTFLRGSSGEPVVRFQSDEGPDSKLIGFSVRGGGGGISCLGYGGSVASSSIPHVSDCIVENNFIDVEEGGSNGAGVVGNPILERCILRANSGALLGGGVYGAPTLLQCLVEDNFACDEGGGLYLFPGARAEECILRRNSAGPCSGRNGARTSQGGGVAATGPGVSLERCLLVDNVVDGSPWTDGCARIYQGGGALAGPAALARCTIVGNRADECALGGGLLGDPTLVDCIVRANEDSPAAYASRTAFTFSDVEGGAAGMGSFDADPLFVDAGAGDLRLREDSPCIDRGDPSGALDPDGTRADGGAWYHPQGARRRAVAWLQTDLLEPAASPATEGFARSVAISGDTALVGATFSFSSTLQDALVFRRQGSDWVEIARLAPSTLQSGDAFGSAVALQDGVAAVAAPENGGAVYVFEGDGFTESVRLVPEPAVVDESFGSSVALDGGTLVVGAEDTSYYETGRALVFQRLGRGEWRQVAELVPPGASNGFQQGTFGASVAISGRTIVVGAPEGLDEFVPRYIGTAFVYERAGNSPYSWVQVAELAPPDPQVFDGFGRSVALSGDTLVVGSRRGVWTYERSGPGLPWRRAQELRPEGSSSPAAFGSVLIDADQAWIEGHGPEIAHFQRANAGAPWFQSTLFSTGGLEVSALAFDRGTLLAGDFFGQSNGRVHVFAPGIALDAIGLDQASEEETVVLRGAQLDSVTAVRVGGVAQPIVSQSASELVLRPARRDPGFADLTLGGAEGELTLAGGFESLPSLRATSGGLGGRLEVKLTNGAGGAYLLLYSLDLRARPFVLHTPPTWYSLRLDLAPGISGQVEVNAFDASGVSERSFPLPNDPALVALPFYLQAWCRRGLVGPRSFSYSFSNVASSSF